jgi:hypothetical protein
VILTNTALKCFNRKLGRVLGSITYGGCCYFIGITGENV